MVKDKGGMLTLQDVGEAPFLGARPMNRCVGIIRQTNEANVTGESAVQNMRSIDTLQANQDGGEVC